MRTDYEVEFEYDLSELAGSYEEGGGSMRSVKARCRKRSLPPHPSGGRQLALQ